MHYRFFDKLTGMMGSQRLTFVGWIILKYCYHNTERKLSMNKFSQKVGITFAHVSRTMSSLSDQGLIAFSEKNGRTKDYNITKKGISLLKEIHEFTNPEVNHNDKIFN